MTTSAYTPLRPFLSSNQRVRDLDYHLLHWGQPAADRPLLVLLHGWMDSSPTFQFVVDALRGDWCVVAPDWRGFGQTQWSGAQSYWFPDYLADLDRLLDELLPGESVDLVGHSMGGNLATLYAGLRPARVRRLVNLEGTGLEGAGPEQAPLRYREWLDQLRDGVGLRDYPSRAAVAQRLMRNNPRLRADYAAFLAGHWGLPTSGGRFAPAGDPAHRIVNPILYRVDEITEIWRLIEADVLWVLAEHGGERRRFVREPAYRQRLAVIRSLSRETVAGAGHMLHHDQPAVVAALIEEFLS